MAILTIDLEEGDLTDFDEVVANGGSFSEATVAAMNSTDYGAEVIISGSTVECYGENAIAIVAAQLTAIIWLDPNTLAMNSGDEFTVLRIRATVGDDDVMALKLNYDGSNYRVRAAAYEDDGTENHSAYEIITDGPHRFDLVLDQATSAVASDGQCELWIDTVLEQTITTLDNYDIYPASNELRVGAVEGVDANTSGIFYIDEISIYQITVPYSPGTPGVTGPLDWTAALLPSYFSGA